MPPPSRPTPYLPVLQAGLTAGAYMLVRETHFPPWLAGLDEGIAVAAAVAVVVAWHLLGHRDAIVRGAIMRGALAGAMSASGVAVLFLVLIIAALAYWTNTRPLGLPGGGIVAGLTFIAVAIGWIAMMFSLFVAAVAAGVATGGIAQWVVAPLGRIGREVSIVLAGLAVAIPGGALAARATFEIGLIELVAGKELRPFPVEVAVDLTRDGRPLRLARVVACRRPDAKADRRRAANASPRYWLPSLESFGTTLADGSGVFVIVPDACRRMTSIWGLLPSWIWTPLHTAHANVLASDEAPLIGWTPDAAALDAFDLYVDRTAYNPRARIRFDDVTMRRMPPGTALDPPDRFAPIGWQDHPGVQIVPSPDAQYRAAFAITIPAERWQHYPAVASILATTSQPSFVLDALARQMDGHGRSVLAGLHADFFPGPFIARNGRAIPEQPAEGWIGHLRPLAGAVFPLRRRGDAWVASPHESGVLAFYRRDTTKDADLPSPITVGANRIDRPVGERGAFLFDPDAAGLVRLSLAYFTFAHPDGPFASR